MNKTTHLPWIKKSLAILELRASYWLCCALRAMRYAILFNTPNACGCNMWFDVPDESDSRDLECARPVPQPLLAHEVSRRTSGD